ncbi:MAG: GtrA family protein [Actinomycetota bacterium]|nr:GtrA family protein [Actinomycetota bacterium]MDQ6947867.1 GtrA family protein [Actinomycetota bacterium]
MPYTASDLLDLARSPQGKKMIRYSATSAICVVLSTVILTVLVGLLRWDAFGASLTATAVSTIPSYELNRKWAWGKTGKGHLWKEVVPFWTLAFIGLAFSTVASVEAQSVAKHHHFSHLLHTMVVDGAFIGAFGVLWIGKFIIFNKILFVHHPEDLIPALDGRSGIPG